MNETPEDLRKALEDIRRETAAALDEWDYDRAAGLRRVGELLEKQLQPGRRSTIEEITKEKNKQWTI